MITFVHKGLPIANPFRSPDGTEAAEPADYGFKLESTGGGCMALTKTLPDGRYIWLTDLDGCRIPTSAADTMIGLYHANGDEIECHPLVEGPAWPAGSIGYLVNAGLPLFSTHPRQLGHHILSIQTSTARGRDCVRVLVAGHHLAELADDVRVRVLDLTIEQVNCFCPA